MIEVPFANYHDSQRSGPFLLPTGGKSLIPVPNAGLVRGPDRDCGFNSRSSFSR